MWSGVATRSTRSSRTALNPGRWLKLGQRRHGVVGAYSKRKPGLHTRNTDSHTSSAGLLQSGNGRAQKGTGMQGRERRNGRGRLLTGHTVEGNGGEGDENNDKVENIPSIPLPFQVSAAFRASLPPKGTTVPLAALGRQAALSSKHRTLQISPRSA
eukprot:3618047-Rhodomonas_salina.1